MVKAALRRDPALHPLPPAEQAAAESPPARDGMPRTMSKTLRCGLLPLRTPIAMQRTAHVLGHSHTS